MTEISSKHNQLRAQPGGAVVSRRTPSTPARLLLTVGAAGPIAFLALATLAGLLTPGYDPLSRPVSELATGQRGWLMAGNFFLVGLTTIAFAIGLLRGLGRPSYVGSLFLGIAGLGLFASGLFPTDLPGAPATGAGTIHNTLFLIVFAALLIAYPCHALALRREPGWRGYPLYTALTPVAVVALLVLFVGFGSAPGDPLAPVGGLIQRALLAVALGWMTVVGRRLLTR